jgi:hypothetical protein
VPLYTFYPLRSDGSSLTFETYDLIDDGAALLRAHKVKEDHPSCVRVAIWCGARKVARQEFANPKGGHATGPQLGA